MVCGVFTDGLRDSPGPSKMSSLSFPLGFFCQYVTYEKEVVYVHGFQFIYIREICTTAEMQTSVVQ